MHVEKIFRGKKYKEPIEIFKVSYKPDYKLIPKDEEHLWWERVTNCKPREKIVPGSIALPPLMKASRNVQFLTSYNIILDLFLLQLIFERDNKPYNETLPLNIRAGRDNVAQSDVTQISFYRPRFFKNEHSS